MAKEVKKMKDFSADNKKIKFAAISGIVVFGIGLFGMIMSALLQGNASAVSIWSVIQGLATAVFSGLFTYGFYLLGKRYDSKLLRVVSVLMIITIVISYFGSLYIGTFVAPKVADVMLEKTTAAGLSSTSDMTQEQATALWGAIIKDPVFLSNATQIIVLLVVYLLVMAVLVILTGVALIKLKNSIEYAKVTGILQIVGVATAVVLVGFIVLMVATVFQIVILFKESKK